MIFLITIATILVPIIMPAIDLKYLFRIPIVSLQVKWYKASIKWYNFLRNTNHFFQQDLSNI